MKNIVTILFIIISSILLFVNCSKFESGIYSENYLSNTGTRPSGYDGILQGDVLSDGNIIFGQSDNIEDSINNSSLGKLWLVFSTKDNNKIAQEEIPSEAMNQLNTYFKYRLHFCLIEKKFSRSSADEKVRRDMKLMKETNKVTNELLNINIIAPDGKRKISQIEADRIMEFIIKSAVKLSKSFV